MTSRFSLGLRYAAAGALSFSLMSAMAKVVGARLPVQEIILLRGLMVTGLIWLLLRREGLSPWGRERPLLVFRGLLGYGALTCFFLAVLTLPLADTTTIHFTNPVFGALFAALALGEVLRRREVFLVLLSLAGVVLVARPAFLFGGGSSLPAGAVGIALMGAILSAGAYVTTRRLTRTNDPLVIVFYFSLLTVVGSFPFSLFRFVLPRGWEWLLLLGVGVTTLGGQIFITRALQLEKAVRVMAAGYLQIVFAALLGMAIFREVPDHWSVAGAAVIILSTFLMARIHPVAAPAGR